MGEKMAVQTDPTVVGVSGPADIRTIAEIHKELLQALQRDGEVSLDLSGGAEVDLTFVQLVESARHFTAAVGKAIKLTTPASEALREILQRGGFLSAEADRAFWLHVTGEC
jgi:ABC-type transporter Mla MlaB component